ncbi:hypothetical protein OUZ56_000454 [Daphnia magna]|uniref:Uncharacterized protein n=1 Tax=Daphnia magna TaxID=35525 RepID=A0ABQ9ZZV3_9CRUS|nr:hypothetical protein OUZ56_000454 [Daphnia magna]
MDFLDDSCIGNIFLLLGTRNIGCLDANQVSLERLSKVVKEKPKVGGRYIGFPLLVL